MRTYQTTPRLGTNTTVRMRSAPVVIGLLAATRLVTAAVEGYDPGLGPEITQQPVGQIVAVGGYAQFSVRATGDGQLSYQWTFNGADLEGAIRSVLRMANVQPARAGEYAVRVTDANGSTTSQPAVLTVDRDWNIYIPVNSGLPYQGVTDLEVDRDGNVWIATGLWNAFGGAGLARFNGRDWTVYLSSNSPLPSDDCTGSTLDVAGNLWIAGRRIRCIRTCCSIRILERKIQ